MKTSYIVLDTIDYLREEGFDDEQIIDAMMDGEYLSNEEITQETAEEIISILRK